MTKEEIQKTKQNNKEASKKVTKEDLKNVAEDKKGAKLCGGSKLKLEKGSKVCPKCGKIHSAEAGCKAVDLFKYRKLGG